MASERSSEVPRHRRMRSILRGRGKDCVTNSMLFQSLHMKTLKITFLGCLVINDIFRCLNRIFDLVCSFQGTDLTDKIYQSSKASNHACECSAGFP